MAKKSKDGMVDLGISYGMKEKPTAEVVSDKDRVSYPTLYLPPTTKELPDFPDGDFFFMCKGKVKRSVETESDGKETNSYDIDVKSICVCDKNGKPVPVEDEKEPDGEEELDKELTKIADRKSKK